MATHLFHVGERLISGHSNNYLDVKIKRCQKSNTLNKTHFGHNKIKKNRRCCAPTLTILTALAKKQTSYRFIFWNSSVDTNSTSPLNNAGQWEVPIRNSNKFLLGTQTISKVIHSVNMAQKQTNSRTPESSPLLRRLFSSDYFWLLVWIVW